MRYLDDKIEEIYAKYKETDGFLYVYYTDIPTFG